MNDERFPLAGGTTLLRREQVAERLNVSRSKVQSLMASGELRTVRLGGCVRVRAADLEQFIVEHLSSASNSAARAGTMR